MPQCSKLCQEAHSKKARLICKQRVAFVENELAEASSLRQQLINEENLRFLVNERSIKLSQEAEKSTVLKEKLEEHARKLQRIVLHVLLTSLSILLIFLPLVKVLYFVHKRQKKSTVLKEKLEEHARQF